MNLETKFLRWIGAGFLLIVLLNLSGLSLTPSTTSILPELCLFKLFLGIECPGCGMTRAMLALANFDVLSAYSYNPFSFLMLFLMAWSLLPNPIRDNINRLPNRLPRIPPLRK